MTDSAIEARHRKQVLPWQRKVWYLVSDKLADARAHAENAVTDQLKATPDGRLSVAKVRQNPSFRAAMARIDELWTAIGGPAVTSLNGLVQDCTEDCYRDSLKLWTAQIPAEYQARGNPPSSSQLTYVRGLLWFGRPIRTAFDAPITRAKTDLECALGAAGSTAATKRTGNQALRTWEAQARTRLIQFVGLAVNDACQRANLQAMRDVIDPRFLSDEAKQA